MQIIIIIFFFENFSKFTVIEALMHAFKNC